MERHGKTWRRGCGGNSGGRGEGAGGGQREEDRATGNRKLI